MKTKGISVVERMIEKIVLAVALVIFLVVFAIQFLGTPTVELPGGMGTVPIDQATDAVAEAARTKVAQLESVGGTESVPQPANLGSELIEKFNSPVAAPVRLARLVPPWDGLDSIAPIEAPVAGTGDGVFAVPTPVAPSTPTVAVILGTVDPSVPLLYPEAAALLPEEQPMDKAIVSVQVELDAAANRARMAAVAEEGQSPLPQSWRDAMEIWDVVLVRRELGSDGSWGAETIVPPMPGRPSLRERLATATPPDISALQSEERSLRAGIRQPRMYNLIAGDYWTAPALLQAAADADRPAEVERLLRQVRTVRSEIESIERRLANLGSGGRGSLIVPRPDRFFDVEALTPSSIRWPSFADSARAQASGGGGGGGGGGTAPRPREDPQERQRSTLEKRLEVLRTQLQRAIEQLESLGYDDTGNPLGAADDDIIDFSESALVSASDAGVTVLSLWGHDLTAEPGQAYQYAVRVSFRNPLFGNAGLVGEQQQELAGQPVLESELSEWSEPVVVPSMSEFFVVGAGDGVHGLVGGSGPNATIEAYRYFYGAWRHQTIRLSAGDSLNAAIDLSSDLPRYVLSKPEGQTVTVDEEIPLETTSIGFSRQVYLLDVVSGVEDFVRAYFRGDHGQVVARDPEEDRLSPLLGRIRGSVERAGNQQLRPLDPTDSVSPGQPVPERPRPGDEPAAPTPGVPVPAAPAMPSGPGG